MHGLKPNIINTKNNSKKFSIYLDINLGSIRFGSVMMPYKLKFLCFTYPQVSILIQTIYYNIKYLR